MIEAVLGVLMMTPVASVGSVPPMAASSGCNDEPECRLPTVRVRGRRPSPRPSFLPPMISIAPPPGGGRRQPVSIPENIQQNNCQLEEVRLDQLAQQAKRLIEAAERARAAQGLPWVEHGVVFHRERAGGTILMTTLRTGDVRSSNGSYNIDLQWPTSGQILGAIHSHPLNGSDSATGRPDLLFAVPSRYDWADQAAAVNRTGSPLSRARMYILHNGQIYQYTRVLERLFTQGTGEVPTSLEHLNNVTNCPPEGA